MADKRDPTMVKDRHSDNGSEHEQASLEESLEAVAEGAGFSGADNESNRDAASGAVDASLQDQITALQEQLVSAKEQTLRAAAEMQNVRKRAERDVANAHKYGQEKLISSLLPVLDNLDRAIESVAKSESGDASADGGSASQAEALKSIVEGVELTRKSAFDVLGQFSVEVLEPYGEPFDPQLHEAITMVPSATAEPNSVLDVLQKGYRLNGRLLRAAMVVVAKA